MEMAQINNSIFENIFRGYDFTGVLV